MFGHVSLSFVALRDWVMTALDVLPGFQADVLPPSVRNSLPGKDASNEQIASDSPFAHTSRRVGRRLPRGEHVGKFLMPLIIATAAVTMIASSGGTTVNDIYVGPNGYDAWAGTQAEPFATLERARDSIGQMKRAGKLP